MAAPITNTLPGHSGKGWGGKDVVPEKGQGARVKGVQEVSNIIGPGEAWEGLFRWEGCKGMGSAAPIERGGGQRNRGNSGHSGKGGGSLVLSGGKIEGRDRKLGETTRKVRKKRVRKKEKQIKHTRGR